MNTSHRHAGLTIIELVVSLSIIAAVSTIALVGLGSARESARNMACVSNQRQLGIAISAYEASHRALPINVIEEVQEQGPIPVEMHSAHARLLPFLEAASTVGAITFGIKVDHLGELKMNAPPVLRCPSESKPTPRSFNYCFSIGTRGHPSSHMKLLDSEKAGAFGTSFSTVSAGADGLSNLIFVSERSVGSRSASRRYFSHDEIVDFEQGNGRRDWYSVFFQGEPQSGYFTPNQWTQVCSRTLERKPIWLTSTAGLWTLGEDAYLNQIMTPNSQIPDCGMLVYPMMGTRSARSEHKNHVNVLFGDGSVRAIDDDVELQVWRALGAVEKQEAPTVLR